ncbi:MAG: saccharopine dehydrogenase NADP-binding domain-containing protein, partial [Candidatus Bathyarchaeota archaeon]
MKVLVVGAGGQGAPCASILSRDPEVSEIVLADINLELAKKVAGKIGSDKIATLRVDAGNLEDLLKASKGVNAIINLTLPRFNVNTMEAALKSGAHYVDTALGNLIWRQLIEKKPLKFDDDFKEAGLTAVIGCGGSPGTTSVLIR